MKQYEYKVMAKAMPAALTARKYEEMAQAIEDELNEIGSEGWEFVQWKNTVMIFKRERG